MRTPDVLEDVEHTPILAWSARHWAVLLALGLLSWAFLIGGGLVLVLAVGEVMKWV